MNTEKNPKCVHCGSTVSLYAPCLEVIERLPKNKKTVHYIHTSCVPHAFGEATPNWRKTEIRLVPGWGKLVLAGMRWACSHTHEGGGLAEAILLPFDAQDSPALHMNMAEWKTYPRVDKEKEEA